MRFTLSTVGDCYNELDKRKLDELGFVFTSNPSKDAAGMSWTKTDVCPTIELDSIDDLKKLSSKFGRLIVKFGWLIVDGDTITMCDDHPE